MEENTSVQESGRWRKSCDTLNRDTTLIHFWQFHQQMEGYATNTTTPWPHRCQWSSTEDMQGKGFGTTPTLRSAEQWEQTGWKESSLERAGQNLNRSQLEWRPDHRAVIHWSTFRTEQGYNSWSWQGQIHQEPVGRWRASSSHCRTGSERLVAWLPQASPQTGQGL